MKIRYIPFKPKNKYLFFLYKLIVLVLLLLVLDYFTGNILRHFYFTQKSGKYYRSTYSIDKANADFIIIGSSRANHHYNPDVFEKELGLSFYNAGRDGSYLFYHYAVLRSILKRYTPYIIILDVRIDEFNQDQLSYDGLSSLLPYYRDHPEIRSIVQMRGPYEKIKLVSSIYPFNSLIFSILAGNLGLNSDAGKENKGYVPLTKTFKGASVPDSAGNVWIETDPVKTAIFEKFISECKSSGVRLFIVCSPYFQSSDGETIKIAQETAEKYGVLFFDYSKDPEFRSNPELFADESHLNQNGSIIFSEKMALKIKDEIFRPQGQPTLLISGK